MIYFYTSLKFWPFGQTFSFGHSKKNQTLKFAVTHFSGCTTLRICSVCLFVETMYFLYSLGGVTFNKCWITLSILNCYSPNFQGFILMKNALNNQVGMLGNMFLWLVANLKQGVVYFIKQALPPNKSAGSVGWANWCHLHKLILGVEPLALKLSLKSHQMTTFLNQKWVLSENVIILNKINFHLMTFWWWLESKGR